MKPKKQLNSAEIELALDLTRGSWNNDKSPEMKALKKIIKTFPWIKEVAFLKYDRNYADAAQLKAAVDALGTDGIAEILEKYRENN